MILSPHLLAYDLMKKELVLRDLTVSLSLGANEGLLQLAFKDPSLMGQVLDLWSAHFWEAEKQLASGWKE